jgi:signal transduction histidine kinase
VNLPRIRSFAGGVLSRQWVTAALAALLIAISLALALQNERLAIAEQTRQMRVQAQVLAAGVASALAFDDIQTAREYLQAFRQNRDIQAAAVYDAAGVRVVGFSKPGSATPDRVTKTRLAVENGQLSIVEPVYQRDILLGYVHLRKSIEPFAARASRYAPIGIVVLLAAMLIGLLGAANAETAIANRVLESQIAARERAERELRQAQKMEALGQLTGGVAHDFNNVLAAGLSGLQLLRRAKSDERREALLDAIEHTLQRGASLTRQLLTFARQTPVEAQLINPCKHLEKLAEMLRHSLSEGVELSLNLPPGTWAVEADVSQFDIAILNLTVNARDAMPKGGTVSLSVRNRSGALNGLDAVEISLKDNGAGIPPEIIEKVFDPFFTTKERGQGTGLGLSQVYGFVNASHGEVSIVSEVGTGTEVSILLQRAFLPADHDSERAG